MARIVMSDLKLEESTEKEANLWNLNIQEVSEENAVPSDHNYATRASKFDATKYDNTNYGNTKYGNTKYDNTEKEVPINPN